MFSCATCALATKPNKTLHCLSPQNSFASAESSEIGVITIGLFIEPLSQNDELFLGLRGDTTFAMILVDTWDCNSWFFNLTSHVLEKAPPITFQKHLQMYETFHES